jgi:hypothetical protein
MATNKAAKKKPSVKQIAARKRFAAAAKAGTLKKGTKLNKNPLARSRSVSGKSAATRKAALGRKAASSLYTAGKKTTSKHYLVARVTDGADYKFMYYNGVDRFLDTRRGAKRYATKADAMAVGKGLLPKLPYAIIDLRSERVA